MAAIIPASPNDTVLAETRAGVCWLTFNRPAALNALDADMVAALRELTAAIEASDEVRVVVLRGGDNFMAGGDLKWFKGLIEEEPDKATIRREFERFIHTVHPIIIHLRRMRQPVIASVRGAAAGVGVSLVAAADLALAADDAVFTLAYCNIGTSPDGGSTYMLPRMVGLKRAFEIALLGDRFDAETARQAGLVTRVVPAAELAAETEKLAARLAKGPAHAYGNTKALLNASLGRSLTEQLDAEAASFADCAATDDFAEGLAAFVEKRPPRFGGS